MRLYTPFVLAAASLAVLSSAQTSLVANNSVSVPVVAYPPSGATILGSLSAPFTGSSTTNGTVFTGTLTTTVYRRVGVSTLDFAFQIANSATSVDALEHLTVSGYTPFTTSVLQTSTTNGAGSANRTGSGVVSFNFLTASAGGFGYLMPGATSSLLVIQTNATAFSLGSAALINGGTGNAVTYAPVPEPSAFAALGLGAVAVLRRRARKA